MLTFLIEKRTKVFFTICFLLVVFFSFKTYPLKTLGYESIPNKGEILDEYDFGWIGKSFLETGIPVAWSDLGIYSKEHPKKNIISEIEGFSILANGEKPSFKNFNSFPKPMISFKTLDYGVGDRHVRFVQPYLDHPPLAGIVYSLGLKKDVANFDQLNLKQIRQQSIYLAIIAGILLFFLGTQLYGSLIGLIAFLFYSTVPSFVFASRLALAENVLLVFFLGAINLLILSKRLSKNWILIFSGILAGLGSLTKLSGWAIILVGLSLLISYKFSRRKIISFLLPAVLIGSLYFFYSFYLGGSFFIEVILDHSSRLFLGALSFFQQISRVSLSNFPLDGWWIGGFFILAYLTSFKENRELGIISGIYLFSILFLGGGNYTWYYFPLMPFLALSVAVLIKRLAIKCSLIDLALFFIFPVSSSFYWGFTVFNSSLNLQWFYRLIIIFFGLLGICFLTKVKQKFLFKFGWILFLILLVHRLYIWNFRSVLYLIDNWGKLHPPLTW